MVEQSALDEAKKQLSESEKIHSALVIGAGWVGRQIVLQLSAFGIRTSWLDQSPASDPCTFAPSPAAAYRSAYM